MNTITNITLNNNIVSNCSPKGTFEIPKFNFEPDKLILSNTVNFKGKEGSCPQQKRFAEIKTSEEYNRILERIYNYKDDNGKPIYNLENNLQNYPKVKRDEEGLLLYAGTAPLYDDINRFLSDRPMRDMTPAMAKDVIRVLEYSLNELDKKKGKYRGIVYRQGVMPQHKNQYLSATVDPIIGATLWGGICTNKNQEFNIIKIKSGHKINEFQKKMGSDYYDEEDEIIIPKDADIREVDNPQGVLLAEKNKFIKILEKYAHGPINYSKVHVYEEI